MKEESFESWNKKNYENLFGDKLIYQENISRSKAGVLRGLHFQIAHLRNQN